MKNILIVGDSLGLPRQNLSYYKTWPYLMASAMPTFHFIFKMKRALTTKMFFQDTHMDWLEFYNPDDVIMQVGIVDCAPRFLKKDGFFIKILSVSPGFINNMVWKIIKKYGKRSPKFSDVSPNDFKSNLQNYLQRCDKSGVKRVFLIKIACPGSIMIKSNPTIYLQVKKYNEIIEKIAYNKSKCILVDTLEEADDSYFLEDGYHLSELGNKILFYSICKVLND